MVHKTQGVLLLYLSLIRTEENYWTLNKHNEHWQKTLTNSSPNWSPNFCMLINKKNELLRYWYTCHDYPVFLPLCFQFPQLCWWLFMWFLQIKNIWYQNVQLNETNLNIRSPTFVQIAENNYVTVSCDISWKISVQDMHACIGNAKILAVECWGSIGFFTISKSDRKSVRRTNSGKINLPLYFTTFLSELLYREKPEYISLFIKSFTIDLKIIIWNYDGIWTYWSLKYVMLLNLFSRKTLLATDDKTSFTDVMICVMMTCDR